mmetsp:Transcript_45955/g.99523  ORF Transcript_45955/g.99523 Transcript_45955/m.99523 type:complete len:226 (+) Transcript_45955:1186-1863(+)
MSHVRHRHRVEHKQRRLVLSRLINQPHAFIRQVAIPHLHATAGAIAAFEVIEGEAHRVIHVTADEGGGGVGSAIEGLSARLRSCHLVAEDADVVGISVGYGVTRTEALVAPQLVLFFVSVGEAVHERVEYHTHHQVENEKVAEKHIRHKVHVRRPADVFHDGEDLNTPVGGQEQLKEGHDGGFEGIEGGETELRVVQLLPIPTPQPVVIDRPFVWFGHTGEESHT